MQIFVLQMRPCGELHGPDKGGGVAGNGHRTRHPPREHKHREPELVQYFVHRGEMSPPVI